MSKQNNKANELKSNIENLFNVTLSSEFNLDNESQFYNDLQDKLAIRIEFYINHKMDLLMHNFYKIDLDQRLVDEAFDLGEVKKIAKKLAELTIKRQLKKLEYRMRHTGE